MKKGFSTIMSAQFFSSLADNALLVAAVELLHASQAPAWQTPALAPMFALFTFLLFGTLALFLLQPLFLALDGNVRFAGVRLFLRPWRRWGRRRHHGSGWRRRLCGRRRRRRWGRGHEGWRGLLRNR